MDLTVVIHNPNAITVTVNGEHNTVPAEVALVAAGLGYFKRDSISFRDDRTRYHYWR